MSYKFSIVLLVIFFNLAISVIPVIGADWLQLQNGPQRRGYSSEDVGGSVAHSWSIGFPSRYHDKTFQQVQPVIANNRVMIGTTGGTFYCFDGITSTELWKYPPTGQPRLGPITGTAGIEGDKVFFGSLDGSVYALNTSNGSLAWKFTSGRRYGFSAAVLLAENRVFVTDRGGMTYCLDQSNGTTAVWQRDIGVPVIMSSCYDSNRIFIGATDMRMYAINSNNGTIAWTSAEMPGMSLKDFWPVAYNNYVIIRPAPHEFMDPCSPGTVPAINGVAGLLPPTELDKQDTIITCIQNNRQAQSLFVFNQSDGQEPFVVVHWNRLSMNGAPPPPCVDRDGYLVISAINGDWPCGWGRLDLNSRKVIEIMVGGEGAPDENLCVSAAGRFVYTVHVWGSSHSGMHGCFDLDSKSWTVIAADAQGNHEDEWLKSCVQGTGGDPAAISNGRYYHNTWGNLICYTLQ